MIESFELDLIKQYGPNKGCAVCFGDQRPSPSTGFESAKELFAALGYSKFIDVDYNGKAQVNHDLNFPLPPGLSGIAGLVFDGGTSEHVCNISQSLLSLLEVTAVNGVLIQTVPLNCYGASYYGLDPQLQRDFFKINGFKMLYQTLHYRRCLQAMLLSFVVRHTSKEFQDNARGRMSREHGGWKKKFADFMFSGKRRHRRFLSPYAENRRVHAETHTTYVGVKVENVPLKWPAQGFYPKVEAASRNA
jgi:hypothetical protein